jgi:23S rRNA (cytidine1920-2'-O)/16S rRNA (cytidine1409-2'-O)-methyltransferase
MGVTRRRIDVELVRRKLAGSREEATDLIKQNRVTVDNAPVTKASRQVLPNSSITVASNSTRYASRGGHKLVGALDHFSSSGLADLADRLCLDAGASTGGFTDVLLKRSVAHVVAVDVGYGQLVWALQSDDRVTVVDRTNVRTLRPENLPYRPNLIVADLSFISLTKVLPALVACAAKDADMVLMVKPQFEVGRGRVGSKGVVRDPELRFEAIMAVSRAAADRGWGTFGVVASPLPGPSGNVEYFVWLRSGGDPASAAEVDTAIGDGPR